MSSQKYPELETVPNIEPLREPTFKEKLASYKRYWTTKEGWVGDYVSLYHCGRYLIIGLSFLDYAQSSVYEEERPSSSVLWT
jgi:hypothetical protein